MCGLIFRKKTKKYSFSEARKCARVLIICKSRLEKTRQLFDIETDPRKIEAIVYEEKAILIRIDHLIRNAKQRNITINYSGRTDRS